MSSPVLATKLYIPPPRAKVVLRPRLIEQLNEGLDRKLTLISAPAGFGKTTLVSEWVADCKRPTAWLSLDDGDNDPARFLTGLIAALQTLALRSPQRGSGAEGIVSNFGKELLTILQSPQPPPTESILTALLNEITTISNDFILVLDDYHLTDSKAIDAALTFLIDHLPPQMHLVITTREDPSLPIPRLRARNQLTEIRAADLRFTASEATEFLNQVMGLDLSVEEVVALESHTEGWIAGLQLAALSMKGQEDVQGFIHAFAGDHRYIVDYLVEEVLQRQPEPIRNFLLQTSILDRLHGPLCDAVTSQLESKAQLEALQRGNFFLIPLDDKRHWYRYHHLFADVLRMHLMAEQPDQVPALHRRASEWYEQNGSTADAIRHALAGGDFERAAYLIEKAVPEMRRSRLDATLHGWFQALPEDLFRYRPVLSVHYTGSLLQNGQLDGVEARLLDAERWLDTMAQPKTSLAEMVVVDKEDLRRVPGAVSMYRATIALLQGDVPTTIKYAERALELLLEEDHLLRGSSAGVLGLAYWTSGDLSSGHQWLTECMTKMQLVRQISDAIGCIISLADIRISQGRLRDAMSTYERGLRLATEHGAVVLRGAADMLVGMSELHREHGDLDAATLDLLRSTEFGEHNGLPQNPYRQRVAMAQIQQAQGNLEGALELLDEAHRLYIGDFSPNVHPIAALKTRVWIAQGRLGEALDWAHERGLSPKDDLSYQREFEHITLARIFLAQYKSDHTDHLIHEVIELLERLLKAAAEGERMNSVIEILVLQALAHQMQEDVPTALTSLEHALKLAEPEGYMRMFLAEGDGMAELIREVDARGVLLNYTRKLLSAFEAERKGMDLETHHSASPVSSSLIEPLSQRELDILRLFKTELSGPEIAQELVIALSTVRTHTKSIYSKLNVNSRRGAVRRAIELGLL